MMRARLPLALAFLALAAPAQAATLTDGDGTVTINSDGIVTVWRSAVGGPDNVFLSSLYIRREGETDEQTLAAALGAATETQPTPNRLTRSYDDGALAAEVAYTLTDGPAGTPTTTLSRSAWLTNVGTAPVSFVLFDYTDLDILFDPTNQRDTATLIAPGVIETVSASAPLFITTTVTPEPDQHQISDFLTLFLAFRTSDGPTTLTGAPALGTPFPVPPGDNAFAFSWDVALAPGETFSITQTSTLAPIPLPAPAALLIAGLGALVLRARRA